MFTRIVVAPATTQLFFIPSTICKNMEFLFVLQLSLQAWFEY